ncbi:MAG TPA: hypothetical protein VJQ08_00495 [Candidatus Dormibacteraeota bacterium]|nr:hypothetical protein [Candidatus Dormibacteraeota bacterium]
MRRVQGVIAALVITCACSSANPTFSLTVASVDPMYQCPSGANNAAYQLHAMITARNSTSHAVSIKSVNAEMKLKAVKGSWLEKVGDRYDAGSVNFEPTSVAAGATTPLKITIPSACTSGTYGSTSSSSGATSSGQYEVTMHVSTSSGAYSITARNLHEIQAA